MINPEDVIAKMQEQSKILVNRKWLDIQRILEAEGEVKISLGTTLTMRDTEPGEQAEKSNRLRTTISFSERFTDSVECQLDGHPELNFSLSGPVHEPQKFPTHDDDGNPVADDANLSSPGAVDAGTTPIGEALDQAAAGTVQPLLNITLDDPGWTVPGLRADVRLKAKKAKWSAPALNMFLGLIDECGDNLTKVKELVRPHTIAGQGTRVAEAPVAEPPNEPEPTVDPVEPPPVAESDQIPL